jgi:hypothetical protein
VATLVGATIWALLFAIVGAVGGRPVAGALAGGSIGAVIGFRYAEQQVGPNVFWASVYAVIGALLGPALDAHPLLPSLVGALLGGTLGSTWLRGIFPLVGGFLLVGGPPEWVKGLVLVVAVGCGMGWYISNLLWGKDESVDEANSIFSTEALTDERRINDVSDKVNSIREIVVMSGQSEKGEQLE